jgi:hypothetical protein
VADVAYGQFPPGESAYDTIMNATKNGTDPIGQDDPVYSSPGLEGLAESAQELQCRIDAIEKENKTSMDTMDKLKCEMGDLLK